MATDTHTSLEEAIEAAKQGRRTVLNCPAHDDRSPSLSVGPGDKQPVLINCLAGETRVLTRQGVERLDALAGGEHELLVPSVTGGPAIWQKVPVRAFGEQPLMAVTLVRHSERKVIYATPQHRWFTQYRESAPKREVVTYALSKGDRIPCALPRRTVRNLSSFGVAHGFTYGDGTSTKTNGAVAMFCGAKDEALLPYFPMMPVHEYDGVKRIASLPSFFKSLPPITESAPYLAGWLGGYFAADGSMEGHCAAISSADRESLERVRDICTRLGIVTYPIRAQVRQGYGDQPSNIYKVTLRSADLWPEFFIHDHHRAAWEKAGKSGASREAWKVASVDETDRVEEVYCATVGGAGAFALEDFILTGNCHAGCDPQDVIQAAGLDIDILLMPRDEMDAAADWVPGDPQPTSSAVYPYRDADGTLLYEVVRANYADGTKRFFQRRPNPDYGTDTPNPEHRGPHIWRLDDTKRVPFNLPQLVEGVAAGAVIHIAEGEKCVRALERVIPAEDVATCNSGGAGKWAGEFNHYFSPGTLVIIYADADDKGRQHAREVRENLTEVGCSIRTVEAPPGQLRGGKPISDVADHLLAGRTLASLIETTPLSDAERARTGIDVLDLVKRPRTPTKWVWEGTLAASERILLVGLEGRGKSTLLRQAAVMTAAGLHPFFGTRMEPKRVLFIDGENHPDQTTDSWTNLVGLAVRHASPIEEGMLTILEEWDGDRDLTSISGATWARERVFGYRPDLIIIGPLTNLVERDLSEYEQVNRLRKTVDSLREVCGSAIVMEHHAPLRGNGDKIREVRPYGNGLFLKWPDYGYAMVPTDTDGLFEWRANRGPRVRSRRFPAALRQGNQHVNSIEWPFMEASPI